MFLSNSCNSNFINFLIRSLELKSYLELGLGNFETFSNVNCEKKVGVDIDREKSVASLKVNEKVIIDYTTNFLKTTKDTFDIVFIDADHHRDSVLNDAINSLNILNPRGVICFHDVGPTEVKDTLETACGTAYKAWINIRNGNLDKNLYLCAYEQNDPAQDSYKSIIGILCKSNFNNANFLEKSIEENWESYENNRSEILNILNVEDIVKNLDLRRE